MLTNWVLNLFQGNGSSDDEDLPDVPDDDQYDTEDSFIDDAELVGIFVCIPSLWYIGISLFLVTFFLAYTILL